MWVIDYLRAETASDVEVSIVIWNCQIAPIKQKTVPKLELQAALYAVSLRQLILEGHDSDIGKVYHWTASPTVLQWLRSAHKEQQVFVANRLDEILEKSTVDQWRLMKGTLNPADIGTQGMEVFQLLEMEWLTGPAWIRNPPETWPELKPQGGNLTQNAKSLETISNQT